MQILIQKRPLPNIFFGINFPAKSNRWTRQPLVSHLRTVTPGFGTAGSVFRTHRPVLAGFGRKTSLSSRRTSLFPPGTSLTCPRTSLVPPGASLTCPRTSLVPPGAFFAEGKTSLTCPGISLDRDKTSLFRQDIVVLPGNIAVSPQNIGVQKQNIADQTGNIVGQSGNIAGRRRNIFVPSGNMLTRHGILLSKERTLLFCAVRARCPRRIFGRRRRPAEIRDINRRLISEFGTKTANITSLQLTGLVALPVGF